MVRAIVPAVVAGPFDAFVPAVLPELAVESSVLRSLDARLKADAAGGVGRSRTVRLVGDDASPAVRPFHGNDSKRQPLFLNYLIEGARRAVVLPCPIHGEHDWLAGNDGYRRAHFVSRCRTTRQQGNEAHHQAN